MEPSVLGDIKKCGAPNGTPYVARTKPRSPWFHPLIDRGATLNKLRQPATVADLARCAKRNEAADKQDDGGQDDQGQAKQSPMYASESLGGVFPHHPLFAVNDDHLL